MGMRQDRDTPPRGELTLLHADGSYERIDLEPADVIVVLGDREVRVAAGHRRVLRWDGDYRLDYR